MRSMGISNRAIALYLKEKCKFSISRCTVNECIINAEDYVFPTLIHDARPDLIAEMIEYDKKTKDAANGLLTLERNISKQMASYTETASMTESVSSLWQEILDAEESSPDSEVPDIDFSDDLHLDTPTKCKKYKFPDYDSNHCTEVHSADIKCPLCYHSSQ